MNNISNFEEFSKGVTEKSRPGSASYYAGLTKSTQDKRASQIKKQTDMEDDDPEAYKPLPGDSKKTKTSRFTTKYHSMFGTSEEMNEEGDGSKAFKDTYSIIEAEYVSLLKDLNRIEYGEPELKKEAIELKKLFNDLLVKLQFFGEMGKIQESTSAELWEAAIADDAIETALKNKVKKVKEKGKDGVTIGILREVMRRGMAAWKTGHRPGANQQQWGYARVNSFLTGGPTQKGADKDLAKRAKLI